MFIVCLGRFVQKQRTTFTNIRNEIFAQDPFRRTTQIPDQAEFFQDLQDVVGDVDLPPKEALVGARHVVVMVVVPAFTHGQKREPEVVAARVFRGVATTSPHVRERVDGEGRVQQEACGHDVPPQTSFDAKQKRTANTERPGADEMVFVQPAKFRIPSEIRDHFNVCFFVFSTEPPAHVREPKTTSCRTVKILFGIRMFVVQPMRSGPPERTFLRCRRS